VSALPSYHREHIEAGRSYSWWCEVCQAQKRAKDIDSGVYRSYKADVSRDNPGDNDKGGRNLNKVHLGDPGSCSVGKETLTLEEWQAQQESDTL
jgi:hypothetical protein